MLKSMIVKCAAAGIVGASAVCAPTLTASAAEAENLAMRFDVYAKGLQVFDIKYKAQLTSTAYDIAVKMKPIGFAGLFVNRKLEMSARGVLAGHRASPREFGFQSKKKNRKTKGFVSWGPDGQTQSRRAPQLSKYKAGAVTRALKPGLPDPLTTLLRTGLSGSKPCEQDQRVYNGREIYDLRFKLVGREQLGEGDGGVYRGPAYKCRMAYLPVAGLSKNKHKKLTADPLRFTVWFAPVKSRALDKKFFVPVAATGKLKKERFVAYTRRATISGRPFNAQSFARR